MILNMEGTMRALVVAISLPPFGLAQASSDETDATTTATTTMTLTSTTTLTQTVTRGAVDSASSTTNLPAPPREMKSQGKEYVLQGCYAQDRTEGTSTMLGQNYTAPEGESMSLSLCLKTCASVVVAGATTTYPFVGVASGDSCYCGTAFNTTASEASLTDCTMPCVGNSSEACGGQGFMSVYRLALADSAIQSNMPSSSDGSRASSIAAAQTNIPSSHGSGTTLSGLGDTDTGSSSNPGVIAGITIGSVSGVLGLLLLVFMAGKWCTRRKQLPPSVAAAGNSASSSVTTLTATNYIHDAASIRDAMKIEVRRLDGVVMDQHSPSPRFARKSQIGVAATTGADWQSNKSSPLTPRTPRFVGVLEETHPSTPSIVVHPPEIAPIHGLGERAWHRRRLSAPFPPAGVVDDGHAVAEGEKRDDRRALPPQPSGEILAVDAADMRTWHSGQEDGIMSASSSWRWTMSTASEVPEAENEAENAEIHA